MYALRRFTTSQPSTHMIHRQITRHFTNPKAIPQLSRRQSINIETHDPVPNTTSNTSTNIEVVDVTELKPEPEPQEEECALSNPFYSRLLNSKLDSCPIQPFNEQTNLVWGAVMDIAQRRNRVELMSRWEQIQRGYTQPQPMSYNMRYDRKMDEKHRFEDYKENSSYRFGELVVDINDILQMHDSLEDIVRNTKEGPSLTLGKATGCLDKLLDRNDNINNGKTRKTRTKKLEKYQMITNGQNSEKKIGKNGEMEMRNDHKWKKRQMKLHIKRKRRDRIRMKRKTMSKRNQQ